VALTNGTVVVVAGTVVGGVAVVVGDGEAVVVGAGADAPVDISDASSPPEHAAAIATVTARTAARRMADHAKSSATSPRPSAWGCRVATGAIAFERADQVIRLDGGRIVTG
jgi:hypothetical protein